MNSSRKIKSIRHLERVSSSIRRASIAKILFGLGMGIPSVKVQSDRMQIWACKMAKYVSRMHQRALFEVKNRKNSRRRGGLAPPLSIPPRDVTCSRRENVLDSSGAPKTGHFFNAQLRNVKYHKNGAFSDISHLKPFILFVHQLGKNFFLDAITQKVIIGFSWNLKLRWSP